MAVIDISDFRKGRNTANDPLLLDSGNCVATSLNVWAPLGALQKTPGFAIVSSYTATAQSMGRTWYDETANTSLLLYATLTTAGESTADYHPWGGIQTDSLTPLGYVTGTVSISGASLISATGSGTSWLTHIASGDRFRVDASAGTWKIVSSVEDDTHLTLQSAIPVAVATGSAYTIIPAIDERYHAVASLNGSWWISSYQDTMVRYNGTGTNRIPSAPKAAFLAVFKNYLFGFRTTTAESRLYWSAIKDPTSWPTNNFIDIEKDLGKGAGLFAFGNELICFKTSSMYKVVGDVFDPSNPTYAVQRINTPNDFIFSAPFTPAVHNGTLIFLTANGLYSYQQGTLYVTRVSDVIVPDVPSDNSNLLSLSNNSGQIYTAISFDGSYILKGGTGTNGNPYSLILDRQGAWWKAQYEGSFSAGHAFGYAPMVVIQSTTVSSAGTFVRPLLLCGTSNGYPRHVGWDMANGYANTTVSGSDVGGTGGSEAIKAQWRSKEFNIEYGHFKQLVLYLAKQSTGSLTVGWSIDQATFVTASADMTVGRGNLIRQTFNINQKGSTVQLKLLQESANTPFKVYAAKIYYDPILENRQA